LKSKQPLFEKSGAKTFMNQENKNQHRVREPPVAVGQSFPFCEKPIRHAWAFVNGIGGARLTTPSPQPESQRSFLRRFFSKKRLLAFAFSYSTTSAPERRASDRSR
jgi:hypothetical protein